jgi:uncharacterized membrane protein
MSRKQKSLFTFSVMLNILLLGMIAAFYFCSPSFMWKHGPAPSVAGLSPEAKSMMRESFNSAGDEMRSKFREARETREELVKILSAETFDAKAYDKAAAHMSEIKQDIAANKARVARELAAKLPAEDRRKMANNLVNGGEREGPRRGGHMKRGMRNHGKGAESPAPSAPAQ